MSDEVGFYFIFFGILIASACVCWCYDMVSVYLHEYDDAFADFDDDAVKCVAAGIEIIC